MTMKCPPLLTALSFACWGNLLWKKLNVSQCPKVAVIKCCGKAKWKAIVTAALQ